MNFDKEVLIKKKITIGDMLILGFLFIISFACFSVVLNEGLDTNIGVLICGIMFGLLFLVLFPFLTFKRDYLKLNNQGISFKIPQGLYGKEIFIAWDKIDNIHINNKILTINQKQKNIQEDNYENNDIDDDELYEYEDCIYITTKKEGNIESQMYEIGIFLYNDYEKHIETIKKMWINSLNNE